MTKDELIYDLAERTGISKADAERMLSALADIVTTALGNGHKVILPRIGILKPGQTKERHARNPSTQAPVLVPARPKVTLKLAPALISAMS